MKKLHQLVIKSWLGPFIMTFFIALFVLLMQFLWKYIDELVGKGLEWYVIAELMFYASASLVPMALPLALLLSSLMTFGNMGEHLELAAAKSAGISLQRVMSPLIISAIGVSLGAFYFSNNILPIANLKMGTLLYSIRQQRPALNIKEGVFYDGIPNYIIKVEGKSEDGKVLKDVMIYDHSSHEGNNKVIVADSGRMATTPDEMYMLLTLYNGSSYEEVEPQNRRNNTYPHQRSTFDKNVLRFDMSEFQLKRQNEDIFKNNYQMLNVKQLRKQKDTLVDKLMERRHQLASSLMQNFKYFNIGKDTSLKVIPNDTLHREVKVDTNIIANFSSTEKKRILESAMNIARSNKVYVNSSVMDHDGRTKMIRKHAIEINRKFTLSIACLVLFFIGAPLGAIIRKGGLGLPTVISIIFFVVYYSISMIGEKMAREGKISPEVGMWTASVVLFPIGVFLTYKATTDSVILDLSTYTKPFKVIGSKFKQLTGKQKQDEDTSGLQ